MNGHVYIGTSGYSYKSWDKTFYGDTPKRAQLEYYAAQFPTVELNATFYRLPSEAMVRGWRERVPQTFVYAIKGSRFITHMKKLANLDGGLDKFFERIEPLRERTGAVLWQLPPMLQKDSSRLDQFLAILPQEYRHAVEFRHPSWYCDEVFEILRVHRAAHVALSSGGMPMNLSVTTDFVYIRFHGLAGGAAHDYTAMELQPWAEFISVQADTGRNVYAYFNNDVNVRAPENAWHLMQMIDVGVPSGPLSAVSLSHRRVLLSPRSLTTGSVPAHPMAHPDFKGGELSRFAHSAQFATGEASTRGFARSEPRAQAEDFRR